MLWTITETAKQLSVSTRTIERLITDGTFSVIRIRRSRRLDAEVIQAWIKQAGPQGINYTESARAHMEPEKEPCQDRRGKTVTASTSSRVQQTGTPATPMRKGTAAAEVQARIAARKRQPS